MKPRTIRLRIFIVLWVAYFGTSFISLASKKIYVERYASLLKDLRTQPEFDELNKKYIELLQGASPSAGEVPDLMKKIKRIELQRGVFRYATLTAWFYLCAWLIYLLFKKVRANA